MAKKRTNRKRWIIYLSLVVFACLSVMAIFNGNYILNKICVYTYNGYFIPKESNAADFRPIVWNDGNGEYWIYGEDKLFYYHAGDGAISNDYILIEKSIARKCEEFDPKDYNTWCQIYPPKEQKTGKQI
ncbi:MAG: hypothetical protein ABIK92_11305 [Pseudomonadota bacterium]